MNQPLDPITGKPLPTKKEIVEAIADLQQLQPHQPADDLQKKLQQDIRDMFNFETQRNELNFALSGVERGEMTIQDYEDDLSLAISNYFVKDILPTHTQKAQQAGARAERLALLDEIMEAKPLTTVDALINLWEDRIKYIFNDRD